MRTIKRIPDLHPEIQYLSHGKRPAADALLQRLAFEELHSDEVLAVVIVNFVNCADVGMIECRGRTRLALETLQCLPIPGHLFRQEFQGDEPTELGVLGPVNHTHAAAAQLFKNAIVGYRLADHEGGNSTLGWSC